MKNYYFSLILFFSILSGALLTNTYLNKQLDSYIAKLEFVLNSENNTVQQKSTVNSFKKDFEKQKNMLRLFISKEHIKDIETNILLIQNSLEENNLSDCKEKSIETITTINQINEYITGIN